MSIYDKKLGVTKAIVIDNEDPAGYNRIKVRIPEIHGIMDVNKYKDLTSDTAKNVWVSDTELPWAEMCFPFGEIIRPEINQVVWVSFYDGLADMPVIIGWAGYDYTSEEDSYEAQINWFTSE